MRKRNKQEIYEDEEDEDCYSSEEDFICNPNDYNYIKKIKKTNKKAYKNFIESKEEIFSSAVDNIPFICSIVGGTTLKGPLSVSK